MINKILILLSICYGLNTNALEFSVGAKNHAIMPLVIGILGHSKSTLEPLVLQLTKDLEFSKQFKVKVIQIADSVLKKEQLLDLGKNNNSFAILINEVAGQPSQFEWRLYDLLDLVMLTGKKVNYKNGELNAVAHIIANKIWQDLMGVPGYFNSVIVACKKNKDHGKTYQYIYAFHPANGTANKKLVVDAHTINFAPRWHPNRKLLYYSQHTPNNVRLMAIDEYGRKAIVTNFEGLNLTPAISPKGQIVMSLSSGGCEKLYRYDYDSICRTNKFTAITDCRMHAISPSFIDEDHIVFCAIDSIYKLPRITILNLAERTATFLTGKAFCVSPAYSVVKNKIVYCKKIKGTQQIYCYDLKTKEHTQITTSPGDKDECSWSPCGNYIIFTEDRGKENRIAIWNTINHTVSYLSPKGESWYFPAWSPCYDDNLFVKC